jgi:uncharacterized protein
VGTAILMRSHHELKGIFMPHLLRRLSAIACLLLVANTAHSQVVISQVYGAGGNAGATLRSDFIELHNNGTTTVNLSTWSVQYASSTGSTWTRTNLTGSIPAGGYFLVKQADGSGGTANLPTPDTTGTIAMSGTAGKIALVNNQTSLVGSCPLGGAVVDFVGYGSGANCSETAPTATPANNTVAATRASAGCTDTGNNSADFAFLTANPRNTASPLQSCGTSTPLLAVNDISVPEGNSGATTMTFSFSLSAPAGVGGVVITYATANGTATAGSDYVASNGTVTIAEGATSTSVAITINGDSIAEADETFFVRISAASGATIADNEGLGTIQNDDVTLVQIHDIQGNSLTSPLNGAVITTEGIVTAQKFNNGFFLQTADANVDADPNTSQGIFVFTSTAPPATAAVGNRVRVTGTVTEFTPSTNLNQLSITEIVSVTSIQVLSTGNPLPTPVILTTADFNAASTPGTAEKFEGMRASIEQARVIAGSDGNITESSATSSTTGVFHVILSGDIGVYRPFREPGIGVMDLFPIPSGKTPPRFDTNQERLMVRSRGQIGATALALDAGATISNMTGVMDYFSGTWALLPDAGSGTVAGGKTATAVAEAGNADVTIGAFNLLRFFDEINDSNGAPTLTAAALDKRLTKTSLAICDFLNAPDILGVVEVENLRVLGLLADRINSTCARAPQYVPYLVQGNDQGGINVGFLVSTRSLGLTDRVEALEVTQFGKTAVFNNPDGSTALLNDRPPLLLRAIVHADNGATYPVTVIVNHLRSLNGLDDTGPGSAGWPSEGDRVRNKRGQQAMFLANLVHARQQANPNERIVLLGDFNAFEFNDGYVDVMGIVRGDETAEPNVISYFDSPITRPLIDGSELTVNPDGAYSYVFEGNAQTLDHIVINEPVVLDAADIQVEHARINADFGVHNFGVAGNALRVSDHDPVRVRITVPDFRSADLVASADVVAPDVDLGNPARFIATITNDGPDDAGPVSISMVFDALVTPTVTPSALPPNDNWTCAAPVQGATSTTITCTAPSLTGNGSAGFEIEMPTDASLANRGLRMDVAVASTTFDPANANNTASASLNVLAIADLEITATGPAAPLRVGETANFAAEVRNNGPQTAPFASAAFVFDALVAPVVTQPAGWSCDAPVQDAATTTVTCTHPSLPNSATEIFSIAVPTDGPQQADWALQMAAGVASQWPDNDPSDNTTFASAQIRVSADLDVVTQTTTPTIDIGDTAQFTVRAYSGGPATVATANLSFSFDALVSPTVVAPAGWNCGAPTQTATTTTVLCTAAPLSPMSGVIEPFAISFIADGPLGGRNVTLTSTMSSAVLDPFTNNNQTRATVAVRGLADIGVTASAAPATIRAGETATYTATIDNAGSSTARGFFVRVDFDALITPVVTPPAGWTCSAPFQSGSTTSFDCNTPDLAAGSQFQFQASITADAGLAGRTVTMAVSARTPTIDPGNRPDNASAAVSVLPNGNADMTTSLLGGPVVGSSITVGNRIAAGGSASFVIPVRNNGPDAALNPTVTFSGNVGVASTSLVIPAGWTCSNNGSTTNYQHVCSLSGSMRNRAAVYFSLSVTAPNRSGALTTTSSVNSGTNDPVPGNSTVSRSLTITGVTP